MMVKSMIRNFAAFAFTLRVCAVVDKPVEVLCLISSKRDDVWKIWLVNRLHVLNVDVVFAHVA